MGERAQGLWGGGRVLKLQLAPGPGSRPPRGKDQGKRRRALYLVTMESAYKLWATLLQASDMCKRTTLPSCLNAAVRSQLNLVLTEKYSSQSAWLNG